MRESVVAIAPSATRENRASGPGPAPSAVPWLPLVGAIGGVAGATAIVYVVGGAVTWMRLNAAGVEANQALGAIPQQTLFAVGAEQLTVPALLAAFVYGFFFLVERRRRRRKAEVGDEHPEDLEPAPHAPTPASSEAYGGRGSRYRAAAAWRRVRRLWSSPAGRATRRLVGWLLTPILLPIRWYLRYVPDLLIIWLPILLFLPNPVLSGLNAINATVAAGIFDWAEEGAHTRREFAVRSALALAALTTCVGLADELIHPHELPKVSIESSAGAERSARFIAVDGGNAYLVANSQLTIVPSTSYARLIVTGTRTKSADEESIFNRLRP